MLKFHTNLPKLMLRAQHIKYGKNLKLTGFPVICKFPGARISIGRNVKINSSLFSNLLGLYQRMIIVAKKDARIKIGNNVGMSGSTIYAWEEITIGDNTLIGANCKIMDNDFHPVDADVRRSDMQSGVVSTDRVLKKPVHIGQNVFIGCNCLILKGTEIGDDCVIGAGSVVSGKFEAGSVIAGNPAKVIKKAQP